MTIFKGVTMNFQFLDILQLCPLFTQIRPEDYPHLLSCVNATEKQYRCDEYLWLNGDHITSLGIVLSGSLEISKENAAGQKHILDFVAPGQIFAEGIICTKDKISPVSVLSREASRILFLPFDKVIHPCGHSCGFHYRLTQNMITILGEKNKMLSRKIELLTLKGMREKLATYLLYEEIRFQRDSSSKNSHSFTITPNRNELADYLNVSRSSMCRELGRMKEEGIIDYYQNTFRILDHNALKNILT